MGDKNNNVEDLAKNFLEKASEGKSITVEYNNIVGRMQPEQQQAVFEAMKNIQSGKGAFPDVAITDDGNGKLGDVQRTKSIMDFTRWVGSKTEDMYDTPQDINKKLEDSQRSLERFVGGGGIGSGTARGAAEQLSAARDRTNKSMDQ